MLVETTHVTDGVLICPIFNLNFISSFLVKWFCVFTVVNPAFNFYFMRMFLMMSVVR